MTTPSLCTSALLTLHLDEGNFPFFSRITHHASRIIPLSARHGGQEIPSEASLRMHRKKEAKSEPKRGQARSSEVNKNIEFFRFLSCSAFRAPRSAFDCPFFPPPDQNRGKTKPARRDLPTT
jgi:hypothetical protein